MEHKLPGQAVLGVGGSDVQRIPKIGWLFYVSFISCFDHVYYINIIL